MSACEEQELSTTQHIYPPFDERKFADIVLRTSDEKDFHTQKILLSLSSDVFETMFTLPQENQDQNLQDNYPIVPLTDEANEVYQMLQWIDPMCNPSLELTDLQLALQVADKYNMRSVTCQIEQVLTKCMEYKDSIRIYAIAIRFKLHELARKAAKESLRIPLEGRTNIPEFRFISAEPLQHLYAYFLACAKAATAVSAEIPLSWIGDARFVWGPEPSISKHSDSCKNIIEDTQTRKKWWYIYMDKAGLELYEHPYGLTVQGIPRFAIKYFNMGLQCPECRLQCLPQLLKFNEKFAAEVEKRVSEIALVIN